MITQQYINYLGFGNQTRIEWIGCFVVGRSVLCFRGKLDLRPYRPGPAKLANLFAWNTQFLDQQGNCLEEMAEWSEKQVTGNCKCPLQIWLSFLEAFTPFVV